MDAAIECFARQGFQRTSIEDMVRESNLSTGAIYSYFQSKERIIETLADERQEREKRLIEQALSNAEWTESLDVLFKSFYESLAESSERKERRLGIHLWAEALCNPRVLRLIRRGLNQPLGLLSNAIAKMQAFGQLPEGLNPDVIARILIALFHGLVLQQAWDERTDLAAFVKTAQSMVATYFSSGSKARTAKVRELRPR
ncbi:MAG: TetR/AcrR family transcriptional regulator [Candidatus Binataceae bacterium]